MFVIVYCYRSCFLSVLYVAIIVHHTYMKSVNHGSKIKCQLSETNNNTNIDIKLFCLIRQGRLFRSRFALRDLKTDVREMRREDWDWVHVAKAKSREGS